MNTLYIVTTNQCQMHCPFCYCNFIPQFQETKESDHINEDMVSSILHGAYNGMKFDYVIFHGGEPLLYPKTILSIMDKCKDIENMNFSIQTNLAFKQLSPDQLRVLSLLPNGYGTSYNIDRFYENKEFKEYFEHNIRELSSLGIYGSLLVTVTDEQIKRQNPRALYNYIKSLQGIREVIFERPIFPIETIKQNKLKYTNLYQEVDKYLELCAQIFPRDMTNLFWMVDKALKHNLYLYNTECSKTTLTLYNDRLKFGCPSLEKRNDENTFPMEECMKCRFYKYCGRDCECFNHVCAFPKRTFSYIKKEIENNDLNIPDPQ